MCTVNFCTLRTDQKVWQKFQVFCFIIRRRCFRWKPKRVIRRWTCIAPSQICIVRAPVQTTWWQHLSRLFVFLQTAAEGLLSGKEMVCYPDPGTSKGEEQISFPWKEQKIMNLWVWPDSKHSACQRKYQIISLDQVESNWNVSPCNTKKKGLERCGVAGTGQFRQNHHCQVAYLTACRK